MSAGTRRGLARKVARRLGLSSSELSRTVPVALANALVLGSMYLLKPARNALFLGRFGAEALPGALLWVALLGAGGALLYARWSRPAQAQSSVLLTYPLLALGVVGFWAALRGWSWGGVVYAFYVGVNLFGVVATSLVWLVANAVFDAREARRTFGLIGAGGITGAIAGGFGTEAAVAWIGTDHLLLVAAGLVLAAAALLRLPRPVESAPSTGRRTVPPASSALGAIGASSLLRWIVPLVVLLAIVSALVDIQFNRAVELHFATTDAKTAFFGRFFALMSAAALVFQLLVTPRVLRHVGVGAALLALPVLLSLGAVAPLLLPGLAIALLPKSAELGLRHSLHKSATEILFLAVPVNVKERVKVFLDTIADNVGTGAGALLVLAAAAIGASSPRHLAILTVIAGVAWALVAVRVRGVYVEAFREAIARRTLDAAAVRVELEDPASIRSLLAALSSEHERQREYALATLANVANPAILAAAQRLLGDPAPEIRRLAVAALAAQSDSTPAVAVAGLLADPDPRVRIAAVHYLCMRDPEDPTAALRRFLTADDEGVQVAALGALAEHWPAAAPELLDEAFIGRVFALDGERGELVRCELARLLGASPWNGLEGYRQSLLEDPSPTVIAATIEAAGRTRAPEMVQWLIERLGFRRCRSAARSALARFGDALVPRLRDAWRSRETAPRVRESLPRVLAEVPTAASVAALIELLTLAPPRDRLLLLKALNRLRVRYPELPFPRGHLLPVLHAEAELHSRLASLQRAGGYPAPTPRGRLVWRALEEQLAASVARAFRIVALVGEPKEVYDAYLAVASGDRTSRASAIELLDNVLDNDVAGRVVAMLEADPAAPSVQSQPHDAWLARVIRETDGWVRACAVFAAGEARTPAVLAALAAIEIDDDPIVRETVALIATG